MDKKVRIGILGCANIADKYSIKAFQNIDNAEVISIASRDMEKAKIWAEKFGIKTAETYDSLMENKEVDAIYIPLPIGLHKEWILKATKNGKHIICEKSLAPSLNEAKDIVEECKKNEVVLYENFTCDYHPQHHKVVELIKDGAIGKPYTFQSLYGFPMISDNNFRYNKDLGGSGLNESGAYQVYTVRKLFKKEPVSVTAELYFEKGVDMRGSVMMDFEDDLSAQFAYNLDAVYQNQYSVWGRAGLVKVGRAYAIAPSFKPIVELVTNKNNKEIVVALDIPPHNHFETIFREFCDLILNKKNRREKIGEKYLNILNQAKVLEAIRISARENRKVDISEIQ